MRALLACCGRRAPARLIDDVRFLGGHGSGFNPYNNNHTADPDLHKRWDGQYPSLWVTEGGGGTFADIWTPDTFAQAGFYVSDTKTPGHVYELSNEHHVRNEIIFDHVGELGHQRAANRGRGRREPRLAVAGIRLVAQHHHRQLSWLSRDAVPRAISRRGSPLSFRKSFISATCISTPRAAIPSATTMAAERFCAPANSLMKMPFRM